MSYQDELNRKNGTTGLSIRDCLLSLSGTLDVNLSSQSAANLWASNVTSTSIGVTHQEAINIVAGRDLATQEILSKQDAAKLIL